MLKILLPIGLITGAITAMSLTTSHFLSRPTITLAQAQLNTDQSTTPSSLSMTQARLETILREIAEDIEVSQNQVLFSVDDQPLLLVTDANANRMRLISPIIKADAITEEEMAKMMLANFHTALDGRYAISNGIVYAAFIHPLSSLDAEDFRSAVAQVTSLRQTYGSTYSSGNRIFGAPATEIDTTDSLPAI